jgi:UDP-N-acetylmuramoyl-L-alanyl-D-glutamate--2,6-diaminopimelate ligase
MKLSQLLKNVTVTTRIVPPPGSGDPQIGSLHYNAQQVIPGGLFVAIRGLAADGHDFIPMAVNRGAATVVTQQPVQASCPVIVVPESRSALAALAANFYQQPSERLMVIAITGTNGKTTTTYLVESVLKQAGLSVGVIGTINYRYGGRIFDSPVTTPESLDLQRMLAEMADAGVSHVVMEASSHALALKRLQACRIDVAVFTNLTQDHLDFHGDMQAYWATKRRLFDQYLVPARSRARFPAVINRDDPRGRELCETLPYAVLGSGRTPGCQVRGEIRRQDREGVSGRIETPDGAIEFNAPLAGTFNVDNLLSTAGVGVALGLPLPAIAGGLNAVGPIPGRLERVPSNSGRAVFVDYAHTPDALESVLNALRPLTRGRLVCVFGCGGDRDRGKRPRMGEIVGRLADLAVVTSDNPRSEAPDAIIADILPGVRQSGAHLCQPEALAAAPAGPVYVVEVDRRSAIALAVAASRSGDTLLIAGKGHETYQILGAERVPFNDRAEAQRALAQLEDGHKDEA